MDTQLPDGMITAMQQIRGAGPVEASVAWSGGRHPVLTMNDSGFVIAADGRPPLRGFVDILRGGAMVARRLVVCAWARDGQVGYEFKQGGGAGLGIARPR